MITQKTKFSVGLFLTLGVGIFIIGMIWLGASKFFEQGYILATYFDESVQGLSLDAPVKYRGVSVGRVTKISVAPDYKLVEVLMKIDPKYNLKKASLNNLVATLKNIGITGSMFIELDQTDPKLPDQSPKIKFKPKYPIIPSRPSNFTQIVQRVENALNKINQLDLQGISISIKSTMNTLNQQLQKLDPEEMILKARKVLERMESLLKSKEIEDTLQNTQITAEKIKQFAEDLPGLAQEAQSTVRKAKSFFAKNSKSVNSTLANYNILAQKMSHLADQGSFLLKSGHKGLKDLELELIRTAKNLNKASSELSELIKEIRNNPSSLIWSTPATAEPYKEQK